jgi:nucleoside-triphosphatase
MAAPLLFIVTGSRGAGKTTFCASLVRAAREAGWRTAGLLSHAVFSGSLRTAIEAEDLTTGEIRPLAVRSPDQPTPGSREWQFDRETIAWGNRVLAASTPCDFLVVDELGPLEFERESGWQAGLAAVDSRQYAIAIVVIRAELLGEALLRWTEANVIEIDTPEESTEKARILAEQLF